MKIKLNLKNNYKIVPEGQRTLMITNAEFRPVGKPQELRVTFQDSEGGTISTTYDMNNKTGLFIMGVLISTALGLQDGDDFETKDVEKLIGKKLLCEVVHRDGTKSNDNGEVPTFANIKRIIKLVDDYTDTDLSPRNMIADDDFDDLD
jgi:hypothetical protein